MFRGFMLPSFARYIPLNWSVLLSAVVFAMAHCSCQRFPPLLALGIALGLVYTRTRNLLSPIALHSFWNVYIFWNLSKAGASPFG